MFTTATASLGAQKMVPPPLRPYPYTLVHQTRWTDVDVYGHLNNSIYYHYADTAINTYLIAHCGLDPAGSPSSPIGLMIASSCTFHAPLHFPARVVTGLAVRAIGRSSVQYEVGLWQEPASPSSGAGQAGGGAAGDAKESGNVLAAVVRCTHVFVDRNTRVPLSKRPGQGGLPTAMRTGLEKILVADSDADGPGRGGAKASKL